MEKSSKRIYMLPVALGLMTVFLGILRWKAGANANTPLLRFIHYYMPRNIKFTFFAMIMATGVVLAWILLSRIRKLSGRCLTVTGIPVITGTLIFLTNNLFRLVDYGFDKDIKEYLLMVRYDAVYTERVGVFRYVIPVAISFLTCFILSQGKALRLLLKASKLRKLIRKIKSEDPKSAPIRILYGHGAEMVDSSVIILAAAGKNVRVVNEDDDWGGDYDTVFFTCGDEGIKNLPQLVEKIWTQVNVKRVFIDLYDGDRYLAQYLEDSIFLLPLFCTMDAADEKWNKEFDVETYGV